MKEMTEKKNEEGQDMFFLKAVAMIVAVGIAGGMIIKKKKRWNSGLRKGTSVKEPVENQEWTFSEDAKEQGTKPTARRIMRKEIGHFTNLLEPLYFVSKGKLSQEEALAVFEEWEMQIKMLQNAGELSEKWEKFTGEVKDAGVDSLSDIAFRWLNQMASFGISRDSRDAVQVNEAVKCAYIESGGKSPTIGEYMLIEKAAWFLDANIICKGILTKEKTK